MTVRQLRAIADALAMMDWSADPARACPTAVIVDDGPEDVAVAIHGAEVLPDGSTEGGTVLLATVDINGHWWALDEEQDRLRAFEWKARRVEFRDDKGRHGVFAAAMHFTGESA